MTHAVSPVRFFRVVPTQPTLIVWTFVVADVVGALAIIRDPSRSDGAMIPLLLLQLFAASSGFEVPARRGHYDLLLTSGHHRAWMALVHWATSIVPGVLAWFILAAVEISVRGVPGARTLATGTIAAVGLVSTLPWAITVRLPRFSAGIGWLLALAISAGVLSSRVAFESHSVSDVGQWLWSAWGFLVYPARFVGHDLAVEEALVAAPALALALVSMVAACRWVSRASIPLEAAQ